MFSWFRLSGKDQQILQTFHPLTPLIRGLFEFFSIIVCIYNLINYGIEAPILMSFTWFSEWQVWGGCIILLYCLICTAFQGVIAYVYSGREMEFIDPDELQRIRMWYYWAFSWRDIVLVGLFCTISLTSIAFWITYFVAPWPITIVSYIAHGWLWLCVFIDLCLTTVYYTPWSAFFATVSVSCYYVFIIWYRYQVGSWVYGALDPSVTRLWVLFPLLIHLVEFMYWLFFSGLNFTKEKIHIYIAKLTKIKLISIPYALIPSDMNYYHSQMSISVCFIAMFWIYEVVVTIYILILMNLWDTNAWIVVITGGIQIVNFIGIAIFLHHAIFVVRTLREDESLNLDFGINTVISGVQINWALFFAYLFFWNDWFWLFFVILIFCGFKIVLGFIFYWNYHYFLTNLMWLPSKHVDRWNYYYYYNYQLDLQKKI